MKRWIACILVLSLSARVYACYDYPDGEELRFSLFNPALFGVSGYDEFYYTAHLFSEPPDDTSTVDPGEAANVALWRARCNNVPSYDAVQEAVYKTIVSPDNAFVRYLQLHHDTTALQYLQFARAVSALSDLLEDPWERNESHVSDIRSERITAALQYAHASSDHDIALRYAFLAIRLSYYNNQPQTLEKTYSEFFEGRRETIIDFWAMHFRALVEKRPSWRNYYAAMVFAHAPDKRFAIFASYDRSVPILQTLMHAKTKEEKAAVWFLEGLHRTGRALECLRHIDALQPQSEWLDFLLLREVNKLEDWILTPTYGHLQPSVLTEKQSAHYSFTRNVASDRQYAREVLAFAQQKSIAKKRRVLWRMANAYIAFLSQDYAAAFDQLSQLPALRDSLLKEQAAVVRSLCLVASQDSGSAVIPLETQPVVLHEFAHTKGRFLQAIAMELQRLGNTTDAALLLSQLNPDGMWEESSAMLHTYNWNWLANWRYGVDYFFYLDENYSPRQLSALIAAVNAAPGHNRFSAWMFRVAKHDLPRLYDLLGTKYMRQDKLEDALQAFARVNDTLYTSGAQPFARYLNANPFYADMWSEH